MLKRSLYLMLIAVLALASEAGAQLTPPLTVPFPMLQFKGWNETGTALSSFTIASAYASKPDTLPEIRMTVFIRDTLGNAGANTNPRGSTIFTVTTVKGNNLPYGYTDTLAYLDQWTLPRKNGVSNSRVPDSLFQLILADATPKSLFRVELTAAKPDDPVVQHVQFADNAMKGTDTSYAINTSRGITECTFGILPSDTVRAVYVVLYNSGFGWGYSSPVDTLADSTWTVKCGKAIWTYKDIGKLLPAQAIKVIRVAKGPADSLKTVTEVLFTKPR